jgi:multidrug resistance efflux pump
MSDYMAAQMDSQIEGAISENERLRLRIEALEAALRQARKDAKRYQWIRSGNVVPHDLCGCCYLPGDELDAAIDAAINDLLKD